MGAVVGCKYELLFRWDVGDQGYADGQVLDTPAEGQNDGQLTVVEVDGTLALIGNECAFTAQGTPAWTDLGLYSQAITRAFGKALMTTVNLSTWEEMGTCWHTAAAVVDPDNTVLALQAHATDGRLDNEDGTEIAIGLALNTDHKLVLVLGGYDANEVPWDNNQAVAGYLYGGALFRYDGANYVLLWRTMTDDTATLYAMLASYDAVGTIDDFRVPSNQTYEAVLQPNNKSTFTAANGVSLDAITPEVGGTWTEQVDDWEIQGNRAVPVGLSTPGSSGWVATIASGLADVIVDCIVQHTASVLGAFRGICVRFTNDDNFWGIYTNDFSNTFSIYERNGGVFTLRASIAVAIGTAADHDVRTIAYGQTIDAFLDGGSKISYGLAALNETETLHGLSNAIVDTFGQWDNFAVYARTSAIYDEELSKCT